MLFCASLIWGSSFVIMKNAVDFITPASLLLIRFSLASFFLSILYFKQIKNYPKEKRKGAFLTGICLFFAYYIQTIGLSYTTPGKNAFLTAIYCAIVPFLVWIVYKKRIDYYNVIAAILCLIGIGLLSIDQLTINKGDLLTIIAGFLYAIHILLIKKYSLNVDGGAFTTFQFYSATICALFVSFIKEDISIILHIQPDIFLKIFYLAFFATALCMLFQTKGQQLTNECYASLILSLESVFGVLFSVLFYEEELTLKLLLGFSLIFVAIIISETKLSFLNKKKIMSICLCLLIGIVSINHVQASTLSVNAPYAYIYNNTTKQELYSKNADEKIYPASMTKVMTALVALEKMDNLDTIVTIEKYDLEGLWEREASVANFTVGEKVSYRDLIHAIILPSGADACRATARVLFGSEEEMAKAMTQKAKELGCTNTQFVNTSGLHETNHYTTVKEMAIMTKEALKNDFFKEVFSKKSYRTETENHYMAATILKFKWKTGTSISHIVGCKTGYTDDSRSCLTALVNSQDQDIICVFAKENGSAAYVQDAKTVVNYCNQNYKVTTIGKKDDIVATIKVKEGLKQFYDVKLLEDASIFLKNNESIDSYHIEYIGEDVVVAPLNKGDQLGKIQIKEDNQVLYEYDVVADEFIDATNLVKIKRFIIDHIGYVLFALFISFILFMYLLRFIYRKYRRMKRKKLRRRTH